METKLKTKHQKHFFFHSFCLNPSIRFETQSNDEKVILVVRAHPITQLSWIFLAVIMFFLPFFYNLLLQDFLNNNQIFFVNFFWYSLLFSFVYLNALNYLFNVGIITNKRILDVDFHGVLYKEVTATSINNIEDVTVKSAGFIPGLFHFANVFVQTAGKEQNIEFMNIPKPTETASIINHLMKPNKHSNHGHQPDS